MRVASCLAAILAVLAACTQTSPDRLRLERGVAFARTTLERAGQNQMAAMSLGNTEEMGGGLLEYLAANMPEHADLPYFEDGRPTRAWTVVLRGIGGRDVVIAGYAEDLSRPVVVDTAHIAPVRRP